MNNNVQSLMIWLNKFLFFDDKVSTCEKLKMFLK